MEVPYDQPDGALLPSHEVAEPAWWYRELLEKIARWTGLSAEEIPRGLEALLRDETVARSLTEEEVKQLLRLPSSGAEADAEFYRRMLQRLREEGGGRSEGG